MFSRRLELRPGPATFFKEKGLFAIFLAELMKLKRNLAIGQISSPLTFLSDMTFLLSCDDSFPENSKYLRNCQRV